MKNKAVDFIEVNGAYVDPTGFVFVPTHNAWVNYSGDWLSQEVVLHESEKYAEIGKKVQV